MKNENKRKNANGRERHVKGNNHEGSTYKRRCRLFGKMRFHHFRLAECSFETCTIVRQGRRTGSCKCTPNPYKSSIDRKERSGSASSIAYSRRRTHSPAHPTLLAAPSAHVATQVGKPASSLCALTNSSPGQNQKETKNKSTSREKVKVIVAK